MTTASHRAIIGLLGMCMIVVATPGRADSPHAAVPARSDGATTPHADQTAYPTNAVEFKGHHYVVCDEELTWKDAKAACEQKGGHLVTIGDVYEDVFTLKLAGDTAKGKSCWIGLTSEGWTKYKAPIFEKDNRSSSSSQQGTGHVQMGTKRMLVRDASDFKWVDGRRGFSHWKEKPPVLRVELTGAIGVPRGKDSGNYVYIANMGWATDDDRTLMRYMCEWDN